MTKKRAPNLSGSDISRIVDVLDEWSGPLTWKLLIVATRKLTGHLYRRQALAKHARIQLAFSRKAGTVAVVGPPLITYPQRREHAIQLLQEKLARLSMENDAFREQFVRWVTNAAEQGVPLAVLNKPLVKIDVTPRCGPPLAGQAERFLPGS